MKEKAVSTREMSPGAEVGFPASIQVEVLRQDVGCGAHTLRVHIPPAGEIPFHAHRGVVQRYVLEGTCETQGEKLIAGNYTLLPEHADVASISSEHGAALLLIYDPITA